jgi:outer membrane protein TolC
LNLLWQEWQVIAQARTLFVQVIEQQKQMAVLRQNRQIAQERYGRVQRSAEQGNETQDVLVTNLTALQDIERQINDLERTLLKSRQDLNALLGLSPDLRLDLTDSTMVPNFAPDKVRMAVRDLPHSRPDLLALQAGYRAQDARYRQAILAQFPVLTIGFTRARDTSAIYTHGIAITFTLPIFNRNRGNIAVELATRQKLREEYQARLNKTQSDVERILRERAVLQRQKQEIDRGLVALERADRHAAIALQEGNIDFLAYSNLRASLLAKRMEAIATEQALLEQQIALQGLVGELPANE